MSECFSNMVQVAYQDGGADVEGAFHLTEPAAGHTGQTSLVQQLQAVQHIGSFVLTLRLRQESSGQGDLGKRVHRTCAHRTVKYST